MTAKTEGIQAESFIAGLQKTINNTSLKKHQKYTSAFGVACGLLFLGFTGDTLSTLAAGKGALGVDFNPLLHGMSERSYIAFSILRLLAGFLILVVYWPSELILQRTMARNFRVMRFFLPFCFENYRDYFGAALIMIVGPLKLVSAGSNASLLYLGESPLSSGLTMAIGILLGTLASSGILLWQHSILARQAPVDQGFSYPAHPTKRTP
ncbi:hypothetical protein MYX82_04655 [Acidobacteria bacterium AH-259-D05]|nr:hypothetical protein [Acidobacteria bacterium AH-259-D05]